MSVVSLGRKRCIAVLLTGFVLSWKDLSRSASEIQKIICRELQKTGVDL